MSFTARRLGAETLAAELRCGRNEHPDGARQRGFVTAQLACVWLQAGSAELRLDGRSHRLVAGDAFLRPPGRAHEVIARTGTAWLFAAVPAAAGEVLRRTGATATILRPGLDRRLAARWLATARRLADVPDEELPVLAAELLGLIGELHRRSALAGRDAWTLRACRALDADLRTPLPLVASAVGLGVSAFRARFRAATGLSPRTWRIRRRIGRAQDLLADRRLSLATVAERLGYPDVPTFAKQFRSVVGASPGAWRRYAD